MEPIPQCEAFLLDIFVRIRNDALEDIVRVDVAVLDGVRRRYTVARSHLDQPQERRPPGGKERTQCDDEATDLEPQPPGVFGVDLLAAAELCPEDVDIMREVLDMAYRAA